jgi:hypothetical protein
MPLFGRFAHVTLGEVGGIGTLIVGLRVRFEVEKTNLGEPNKALVQIFNLSDTTRYAIRSLQDVMILEAGYHEDEKQQRLAVQMDVVDVKTEIQRPDVMTSITCADGAISQRTKKLSVSYAGGQTVKSIISDIGRQAGLVIRDMVSVGDAQYQQGFAGTGPIGDLLDSLVGKINAKWSFQNGEVQIAPKDGPAQQYVSVVDKESGLIGSPVKRNKAGEPTTPEQQNGWIFRSLLNPTIEPNGRVELRSVEASGIYRVISVKHTGDTSEGEFFSEVEVEEWQQN